MKQILFALAIIGLTNVASAEPVIFKTYTEANPEVSTFCDKFRELKLDLTNESTGSAETVNRKRGRCDIRILPYPRRYDLVLRDTDRACNVRVYIASSTPNRPHTESVIVFDARARINSRECLSEYPTKIRIVEYFRGTPEVRYSFDL